MPYEDIKLKKSEHIAVLTVNRPEKLNALRTQTALELKAALEEIDQDEEVYAVILTGEGRSFGSGHDTAEPPPGMDVWLSRRSPGRVYTDVCEKLFHLHQPIVAAINGWCAGGSVGLALCCDILIAADDARFYIPQIAYGYPSMPGVGILLYWFCSPAWAKDIILGRRQVDAATAQGIGLVSRVVPRDKLMDEAWTAAQTLAEVPPDIMSMQREMMNRIWVGMSGIEAAFYSGKHTSIAGHAHPNWQSRETNWKLSRKR
ncbi:MAG: enoyl-CoA hydratase/isomerase family protein [Chloroflexi bacterium]|nr:enoyl-CoA hydratase/isomerase family protein [Chloroflexota bacterium]